MNNTLDSLLNNNIRSVNLEGNMTDQDIKRIMMAMHQRGYTEGCIDIKKTMIESLVMYKKIQQVEHLTIDEMINFVESIKL